VSRRWVVKLGSSSLTDHGRSLIDSRIAGWVGDIARLCRGGDQVVLVSSGAVAAGMARLRISQRPETVAQLQAIASIGQSDLIQAWRDHFSKYSIPVGQILLNHSDISNRERYLNARSAISELLAMGAIPVVNENDSVATDEIRLGDNDTLAAQVANLVDADGLILLTDRDGLYTANPAKDAAAQLVSEEFCDMARLDGYVAGSGSAVGTGGMVTKLAAARLAGRSGINTTIASALAENVIYRVAQGDSVGTRLLAREGRMSARKKWLANQLKVRGRLIVDDGAMRALSESGASLLAVGLVNVFGDFARGDCVSVESVDGDVFARGLVNASAMELLAFGADPTNSVVLEAELIHRDNLVILFQA